MWSRHDAVMWEMQEQDRPPLPTCHALSLDELLYFALKHVETNIMGKVLDALVPDGNDSTLCSHCLTSWQNLTNGRT